ncbi:MAG: hypothetical protein DLM68_02465 [Hyphomicrobiales bacterium]|nr:MAG: hypothetical protein DLM68_02465 [Hyphomicrobiales bacterium]
MIERLRRTPRALPRKPTPCGPIARHSGPRGKPLTARIYRMLDKKHDTLVYLAVSSKIVSGSPANSISSVPIMPWGSQ